MIKFSSLTKLAKCQLGAGVLAFIANVFVFIGTITPAWQVAEDLDMGRYVQSGLWLYCPGAAQCWYIFSDNLINYYEKVDVCRFLLIGDCRKKLLRTPYFFGWHYWVLVLNLLAVAFCGAAVVSAFYAYFRSHRQRISTIIFNVFILLAILFLGISLIVFVVNAEMLESKYLIGVKNTFEKYYGYSFYLAGFGLLIMIFALIPAIMMTTFTFFLYQEQDEYVEDRLQNRYYDEQPQKYPVSAMKPAFRDGILTSGTATPMRSSTPMSQLQPLSVIGEYIPPARSPNGEFQPTTRHFYSY